ENPKPPPPQRVIPRPAPDATTIILVRQSAGVPELFMVRRSGGADFFGDAYVFPGGGVDSADLDRARPPLEPSRHRTASSRRIVAGAGGRMLDCGDTRAFRRGGRDARVSGRGDAGFGRRGRARSAFRLSRGDASESHLVS